MTYTLQVVDDLRDLVGKFAERNWFRLIRMIDNMYDRRPSIIPGPLQNMLVHSTTSHGRAYINPYGHLLRGR